MHLPNPFNAISFSRAETSTDDVGGLVRKRVKWVLIPVLLAVVLIVRYVFGLSSKGHAAYKSFVANHEDIDVRYLDVEDTFDIWSSSDVGNDVNTLLSGGKLYQRDGIIIRPTKRGNYIVKRNNEKIGIIKDSISYINVVDDVVYFRSDTTRDILTFDISNGTKRRFLKGNYGEVFVYDGSVYFVDLNKGVLSSVYLSGEERQVVLDKPISSFVVCGDTILALDNEMRLYIEGSSESKDDISDQLATHVERFFINGNIIVESDGKVLSFDTNGENAKLLYESDTESMRLVGVAGNALLVQERGKLYLVNDGEKTLIEDTKHKLYYSPLPIDDNVLTVLAVSDGEGARPSWQMLKVRSATTTQNEE